MQSPLPGQTRMLAGPIKALDGVDDNDETQHRQASHLEIRQGHIQWYSYPQNLQRNICAHQKWAGKENHT